MHGEIDNGKTPASSKGAGCLSESERLTRIALGFCSRCLCLGFISEFSAGAKPSVHKRGSLDHQTASGAFRSAHSIDAY